MLKPLLGNRTKEKLLLFLAVHDESYAQELADTLELRLYAVQQQLWRLESGGVLASVTKGRTRLYRFNPSYPFLRELRALLTRALEFLPADERKPYLPRRTRPRARGKPR